MPIPIPPGMKPKLVSGDQIAADALRYRGAGYVFGGPANHPGNWDCSSFVSYVLGHDLKMALPGGRYGSPGFPPNSHGPTVETYASWKGAITVGSPARGDLVLFVGQGANGHMGIVLGPNQMVSALNSAQGTLVTPIAGEGPPGAPIVYRRVLGAVAGSVVGGMAGVGTGVAATPGLPTGAAFVLLLVAGMAAAVVVAAAVLGVGAAVAGSWAASKVVSQ